MKFLALDFETGDLCDRAPISLGLALFEDGELLRSKEWLFRPIHNYKGKLMWNYSENAGQIHGKNLLMMEADGIPTQQIYDEVLAFLGGIWDGPIVSHNAPFDGETWGNFMFVLGHYDAKRRLSIPATEILTGPWYCTQRLAQSLTLVPNTVKNLRLATLGSYFGIGDQGEVHGAERDAIIAGRLFMALQPKTEVTK